MKQTCATCAWRTTCGKKFSISDPSRCPDYVADLQLQQQAIGDESSTSDRNPPRKALRWEQMQEKDK